MQFFNDIKVLLHSFNKYSLCIPCLFLYYVFLSVLKNDLLLHEAVIKNEADTVRKVLKETVDVDSRNNVSHEEMLRR